MRPYIASIHYPQMCMCMALLQEIYGGVFAGHYILLEAQVPPIFGAEQS
jgi:hypothetical protein